MNRNSPHAAALLAAGMFLLIIAPGARAADDEIMVSDGDIAKPREPELEIHTNYSDGSHESPGSSVFAPGGVLRVTPELSYGLAPSWEVGLYLPVSWVPGHGWYYDGVKARVKYLDSRPLRGEDRWYYGAQLEAADVQPGVSPDHTSLELKLIGGVQLGRWEFATNLVEQRDMPDHDLWRPAYAVNSKLVRDLGADTSVGIEHYTSWSSTDRETPLSEIDNITFLTANWKHRDWNFHVGVGHGWANSPDRTVIKFVIGVPID